MKTHAVAGVVTGAVIALALSACAGQAKTVAEPAASPTSASSATSASPPTSAPPTTSGSPPAVPARGEKPPREFVVGKWGTDGDCEMAIDLRADGTSDGPFGNWNYDDGAISFVDEPDFKVNVTVVDGDTMESTNDSTDKKSRMTRCP